MCFVFIWEQTATCATYSINWLVFMKGVYSAVRTGSLNTAVCASSSRGYNIWNKLNYWLINCATYSINWLVFITEMKGAYSAVRTGSLNTAVCASSSRVYNIWNKLNYWLINCATYSINWLLFITEMKSVYSAVRTGSLNKAVWASSLRGYNIWNKLNYWLINCATYSINWLVFITDERCLQRGTDWVFKYSGLRFVFKGLRKINAVRKKAAATDDMDIVRHTRFLRRFLALRLTSL